MSFGDAVLASLNHYADFGGRSRRAEYWYFLLFLMLLYAALMVVTATAPRLGILAMCLALFGALIPSMAVNIRRLHDVDRSGWWILIGFVPLIGGVLLLIWHCTPGTTGQNRFGPDPKAA